MGGSPAPLNFLGQESNLVMHNESFALNLNVHI